MLTCTCYSSTLNSLYVHIKLNLTLGYRKQRGPEIDLDLLTARTEFEMVYRQLYITLGADLYRRTYLNDITDYNGVYLQLSRKF